MQPSLRFLRYLVAAADKGSVTEAARTLGVSQSSVSTAVAQIEAGFGIQIFLRHHARGLSVTAAGERLLNEARALLLHAREFEANAGALSGDEQGEVSISCFTTIAPFIVPGLLDRIARERPGLRLAIDELNQQEIFEALGSGHSEIAFTYGYAIGDAFATEVLLELAPQAVLAEGHPLASRPTVSLVELADEPYVLLDLPHSRDYFLSLFLNLGIEPRIKHRARSFEMVRSLAGRGLAYGLLNAQPRSSSTYDGHAVRHVPISEPLPAVRIAALRMRQLPLRRAVSVVLDTLRLQLKEEAPV
ncbi:MAG: LysR family transcriptional regulator [Alphaproteobacteria bacterium]|nr:LysR family transcriptional regulator [Alphaproteobacteria bacterium]